MTNQRGGTVTVKGWLFVLMLAAMSASAATNIRLARHRQIVIEIPHFVPASSHVRVETIESQQADADSYRVRIFPSHYNHEVCDVLGAICYVTI